MNNAVARSADIANSVRSKLRTAPPRATRRGFMSKASAAHRDALVKQAFPEEGQGGRRHALLFDRRLQRCRLHLLLMADTRLEPGQDRGESPPL
jgi:hypothetical protein